MKKGQSSIIKNFIMNALLTMSSFIFPLITFPYVSRVLLPVGTGKVSFVTSCIAYFNMFAQLGIPTYGVRACARVRDDRKKLTRVAHELLTINIIMSLFAYIALAICIAVIPKFREEKTLYIVISCTIFLTAVGMEWLYKALEQYSYITIRSIVFKFVALLAMFALVHSKEDYVIYGGITIFAASASNVLNFINVHKYIDLKPVGEYNLKQHLKPICVFFSMACATTIYTNLDSVMLGFMKTDEDVGYYNAAVRIKAILVSIVTSLGTVLLPRASYYIEHGLNDEFRKISKKAMNFVMIIALPMLIYFTVYAREGIYLLSGTAYEGSIIPMQIIMPTLLFIGMTNLLGLQMLVPMGKEKYVLYSEIVGALVDLFLNWLLIPKWGAAGAAVGTLVAEIAVWIVQVYSLKELVKELYINIRYLLILVALIVSTGLSALIKLIDVPIIFTLALSCAIYGVVYLIILRLGKEEFVCSLTEIIKEKTKKKKY